MRRAVSLPTRVALILIGGLIALQLFALGGTLWVRAQETGAIAWPLPDRVAALVELMEGADPEARTLALRALNGGPELVLLLEDFPEGVRAVAAPAGWGARIAGPYKRLLGDRELRVLMRAEPGPNAAGAPEVAPWLNRGREPDPGRFAFAVRLTTGEVLLFDPGAGARRQGFITIMLIVNLVAATIVTLAVLRLLLSLLGPLSTIAARAQSFAGDLAAPPMPERGPQEARALAAAFNAMRAETLALIASRTRMLAAIAHDLKTYMARLRLRVALIEDAAQREKADADIAEIAALLEDSLLVARGESERSARADVDLADIIADIADRRADPRLTIAETRNSLRARADPQAVRRILDNLIDNALAYAGSAEISGARTPDAVFIDVRDRGPGIRGVAPEALFEPFVRGESSRNRATGGSGLGLTIARTLARQMDGEVTLQPREGGGLIARLSLPNAQAPE